MARVPPENVRIAPNLFFQLLEFGVVEPEHGLVAGLIDLDAYIKPTRDFQRPRRETQPLPGGRECDHNRIPIAFVPVVKGAFRPR